MSHHAATPAVKSKHGRKVAQGLSAAYHATETVPLDLESARLIIFSDHHKGSRDGADDFRRCERAYNAALAYYFASEYTVFVLGDAEELWEARPKRVIESYSKTLELEAKFHENGRYERFWGNHDDLWRDSGPVRAHLHGIFPGLKIREALKLDVRVAGDVIGRIFLVHGHQGTTFSDSFGWLSRIAVRHVWRHWQRLTKLASTTPARDYKLRGDHDQAMYGWAEAQDRLILIAGHTHRPVFASTTHVGKVEKELDELRKRPDPTAADLERIRRLGAELEFVRAEESQRGDGSIAMEKPCYFNTGCCSFADGDITGLEIAGGVIRLVRWPNDEDRPLPKVLAEADLRKVFEALGAPAPVPAHT